MSNELGAAVAQVGVAIDAVPCRVTQVTPLLVSFDGGATSVAALRVSGLTYSLSSSNNAIALFASGSLVVLPIG